MTSTFIQPVSEDNSCPWGSKIINKIFLKTDVCAQVFHICGSLTSASNLDAVLGTVCMGKQICVKIIVFAWKSVGQVEDNVSLITGSLCLIGEFPQK